MAETDVHLIRVTTDNRDHQLWAAAAPRREKALELVLSAVPEGWTAALESSRRGKELEVLNLKPGEVREIGCTTD